MAVTLKRKRDTVSYREPDSDEDLLGDSDSSRHTSRTRAAPTRHSTRRKDSTSTQASPPTSRGNAVRPRSSRQRRARKVAYKDISTDEEDEDPDADFQVSEEESTIRPKPVRTNGASPRKSRTSKGKASRKLGAPLRPNESVLTARTAIAVPSDGHVPAWTSLPYHVLLQVFVYASHPLRDENMRPTPSIPWLVQMARICSAFTKPALTALYRNPPVFAMRQTRKDLVYQFITPPANEHEDHRVMVKRLELDATQMTSLTDHSNSVTDLASLVRCLTTLRECDIFDPFDRPPFRERLRRIRRWTYPPELFHALRQSDLRLRSWRWNSAFCDRGPLWIKSMHGEQMFQSLRELTLQKFHPPEVPIAQNDDDESTNQPTVEELLASALAVLPSLKSLSFETCGVVGARLLPLLPKNLVSLCITNCGELLSDHLQAFLATNGAQLKDLILNYNQSLDLSFLVDLKQSCPKLECLRMDLTYYSSLAMSSDNDPLYETLLGESEIPTWPTTLQTVDLQFLRNWNSKSATNFLSSLVDASGDLPWLRELIIIASVDTDWRERAGFRQKWTDKFKKVFARKWVPPNPHLASFKAYREWQASGSGRTVPVFEPTGQLKESQGGMGISTATDSDSDAPLIPSKRDEKWDTKRLRSRSKATGSYDEETDDDAASNNGPSEEHEEEFVIQGRCHTVLFRIDNIRPQEEHFTEADFLDAEPSDDGDWNGNDDVNNDEGGYAW